MRRWSFSLVVVFLALSTASASEALGAPPPQTEQIPQLGKLVATTFLRALVDRDFKTAAPLCARVVDFDGQVAQGETAVRDQLRRLFKRIKIRRRLQWSVVMSITRARQLFGPPPARLHLPKRNDLLVGFGRFRKGGLIVVLAPDQDRWRIVALTD